MLHLSDIIREWGFLDEWDFAFVFSRFKSVKKKKSFLKHFFVPTECADTMNINKHFLSHLYTSCFFEVRIYTWRYESPQNKHGSSCLDIIWGWLNDCNIYMKITISTLWSRMQILMNFIDETWVDSIIRQIPPFLSLHSRCFQQHVQVAVFFFLPQCILSWAILYHYLVFILGNNRALPGKARWSSFLKWIALKFTHIPKSDLAWQGFCYFSIYIFFIFEDQSKIPIIFLSDGDFLKLHLVQKLFFFTFYFEIILDLQQMVQKYSFVPFTQIVNITHNHSTII